MQQAKKESFMQGVLALMFSQVLIKLLGLIYKLYLTNKEGFGDSGNAIYSSGFQIYALLLTLSSIGVPNAISKLVSERTALGDIKGAKRVFKAAFATFTIIGLAGTFILFFGAKYISTVLLQIPEAELTLIALSPSIFFVSISSVLRGYFNGRENMRTTARSQTLEQVFKSLLTVILVEIVFIITTQNTTIMAAGANLATTFATFLSFAYLFQYYKKVDERQDLVIMQEHPSTVEISHEKITTIIKKILFVSIPISLSAVMSTLNKNIDSITVVRSLKNFMSEATAKVQYGILSGKVDTLTTLPLSFNIAFATALVPAIAAAIAKKDTQTITKRISFSLMITMLIGLPCSVGMCIFAEPILQLLFPNAMEGTLVLQISSFTILFTVLTQTVNGALQGIGKVMMPSIALGVGITAKILLNLILVPISSIGVNGAAFASILCYMISFLIGFSVLKKNIKLDFTFMKFVVKPILATAIMAGSSYFIYTVLNNGILDSKKIVTIISIIFAVIVYGISLSFLKVFNKEEMSMIPNGKRIYKILERLGIYAKHEALQR